MCPPRKYHPKGLEAAVFFEVSIDPKGLQTQRVSKVSSCVHIQIETKGHAGHVVGFAVKVTGRDESQGAMTRLAMPLRRCHTFVAMIDVLVRSSAVASRGTGIVRFPFSIVPH